MWRTKRFEVLKPHIFHFMFLSGVLVVFNLKVHSLLCADMFLTILVLTAKGRRANWLEIVNRNQPGKRGNQWSSSRRCWTEGIREAIETCGATSLCCLSEWANTVHQYITWGSMQSLLCAVRLHLKRPNIYIMFIVRMFIHWLQVYKNGPGIL